LLFRPTAFFAAEGSSFFCKSFVSSGPRGLSSLIGKDSVITFKISSTSVAEGVEGVPSSISAIFGSGVVVFLFFEVVTFGSGLDFFSKKFHLLLSS
jgi:intracellular sulfur oxidation DsrE/DsrF family protein